MPHAQRSRTRPSSAALLALALGAGLSFSFLASSAHADVPAQWAFNVVAAESRPGFPAIGVPPDTQISGAGASIDEDGSALCRYTGLFDGSNGLVRYSASTGLSEIVIVDPAADSDTTTDFDIRNGRIGLRWFDSSIRIYDLAGTEQIRFTTAGGSLGTYSSPGRFTLTNNGSIGLIASFSGVRTLFTDQFGTPPRTQVVAAQQLSPVTFLSAQFMNQNGQFGGPVWLGTPNKTIQRSQSGQPPVTLFSTAVDTVYTDIANQSDINDLGHVAFFAKATDPNDTRGFHWELRKGTAAATHELLAADTDTELVAAGFNAFNPDIANNGLVVFTARFGFGGGVFATDGTAVRRIAGAGDTLETNIGPVTLTFSTSAVIGNPSQNEANQVAFIADLSNGATALIIATPITQGGCSADFNADQSVTADDIFAFLDAWFAQNGQTGIGLSADFNADQSVTADDIFAFLDAWFAQNGQTCN